MVWHWEIEANPQKIRAIENMQPPACIKYVQKLTGRLTVLSRFISKLGERMILFFKLLRKFEHFVWTKKAEKAFEEWKRYMTMPTVMVAPDLG
jgi:hypothetical protein